MIERNKTEHKETIGERILRMRTERGWTAKALAKMSDISASALSTYERSEVLPGCIALIGLADAFDITLDELVGR